MNNISNPFVVSDGIGSTKCTVQNPTVSYSVGADDNVIICGANSLQITLTSTSNSPVYVTAADGTTVRSGCTIVVNTQNFAIGTNGLGCHCIRYGPASQNLWAIIGASSVS